MSQVAVKKKVQRGDVILPEEHFWKCYSPQNEFPLSGACTIALHGLLIGALVLVAYVRSLPQNVQALEPPRMDVVEISGGGGTDGFGGPGVGPTIPGKAGPLVKVQDKSLTELLKSKDANDTKLTIAKNSQDLKVDQSTDKPNDKPDPADAVFNELLTDAQAQVAKAANVSVAQASGGVVGGSAGSGGGFGGGTGGGFGTKKGAGGGNSDTGQILSKRQKHQNRWLVEFSGPGLEHLKKLKALRVTLALPTAAPGAFQVVDLSGLSPKYSFSDLKQHISKVKWYNADPQSVAQLALALQMKQTPKFIVIFLPDAVEQEMAELEASYKGFPENLIQYTRFEIMQRPDGSFGPLVVEQKLKGDGKAP